MVDSKQVQDGGLQVMHVNTVLGNVVAVRISSSVGPFPLLPPPPAIHMEKHRGWWSRPKLFAVSLPWQ